MQNWPLVTNQFRKRRWSRPVSDDARKREIMGNFKFDATPPDQAAAG
jgi:hypothetical protein